MIDKEWNKEEKELSTGVLLDKKGIEAAIDRNTMVSR